MPKKTIKTHQCVLGFDLEEFERLPKFTPWRKRFKRDIKMSLLMSHANPRAQLYYRTNTAISAARKKHAQSRYNYIIHPFSAFRMNWELFMSICYIVYLFVVPIASVFPTQVPMFIAFVLDLFCLADLMVMFLTGYTIDHLKQVVLNPNKIAIHYLLSFQFMLDALSSIPTEIIAIVSSSTSGDGSSTTFVIASCLSILKIYKIYTLTVYIKRVTEYWKLSWCMIYVRFMIIMVIVLHWCGCLEYMVPLYHHMITNQPYHNKSWIIRRNIHKMTSKTERYFEATFKAAGHLLCVANPMYRPQTVEDGIVAFTVSTFGYLLSCLGLVIFVQMMFRLHNSKIRYECVMNQLSQYMRHKQLPMSMQKRLIDYYEFRFRKSYFREPAILSILSDRLKQDINTHICTILVQKVQIFQNLPESILNNIVSSLRPEVFLPNDIIVKAGTSGDCMYFIYTGTVAVYTPTGKEVCHLQDGAFFGEVSLISKDKKRIANVVAIEMTEVFRLDRFSFSSYIKFLPELYKKFELIAERRRGNTLVMEEIHRKHILEKTMKLRHDKENIFM